MTETTPEPTPSPTPEELLAQMTLEEKCVMLHGRDKWEISGCERLGIPDWTVSDGPSGVRGREMAAGLMLPAAVSLAASWDVGAAAAAGAALAVESRDRRIQMLLAPTVNIQRLPTCGRIFECFSEDPLLTSRFAVAYIGAVQAGGIGACIKHFVANEQETDRFAASSEIDERALVEVYFQPFEAAVREADVRAVMGSYNRIGGELTCESGYLLDEVLRRRWGFDGVLVSDWSALQSAVAPLEAGIDLDMPGGGYWSGGALVELVAGGELDEALIDARLLEVLRFLEWAGCLQGPGDLAEDVVQRREHVRLARDLAAAGTVLLRNSAGLLPLERPGSMALIGSHALRPCPGGGGAAQVGLQHGPNLAEALRENFGPELELSYAPGVSLDRTAPEFPVGWLGAELTTLELHHGRDLSGAAGLRQEQSPVRFSYSADNWPDPEWGSLSVRQTINFTPGEADGGQWRFSAGGSSEVRLVLDGAVLADSYVDGFSLGPGFFATSADVELEGGRSYQLVVEYIGRQQHQRFVEGCVFAKPLADTDAALEQAVANAAAAEVAVVVVGTNEFWEAENFDRPTLALPDRQDELVRRCVAANPNTVVVVNCGSPVLMPWLEDAGAVMTIWFPGQAGAAALADVLSGRADPGGRTPITWPRADTDGPAMADAPRTYPGVDGSVFYDEGVLIGHRWYERHGVEPLVPFGYGLSYAEFDWSESKLTGAFPNLAVEVAVTNTSDRAGAESVQCYVGVAGADEIDRSDAADLPDMPAQWLAGFAKVQLEPGETKTASIDLDARTFSYWDVASQSWRIPPCDFLVHLSKSSAERVFTLAAGASGAADATEVTAQ